MVAVAGEGKNGPQSLDPSKITASKTPAGLAEGGISVTRYNLAGTRASRSLVGASSSPLIAASYASGCNNLDAWRNKYTLLGSLAYRWHQTKYWCYSNNAITDVSIGYYVSDSNGFNTFQGLAGTNEYFFSWNGNSHGGHYSFREATMQNCFYICAGTQYPWVKIWAYSNGGWAWEVGG